MGPDRKPLASVVSEAQFRRLEAFAALSWLLKDFGWVLLCGQLAWLAALAAILLETHCLTLKWRTATVGEVIHRVAVAMWLYGNAIWMTQEFCLEPSGGPGHKFAWHAGPIFGIHPYEYVVMLRMVQGIFASALAMLFAFYTAQLWGFLSEMFSRPRNSRGLPFQAVKKVEDPSEALVFGLVTPDLYNLLFIGPWIANDLFWTFEMLWPGLICAGLVVLLLMHCLVRFKDELTLAELCWVVGNSAWMYDEIQMKDMMTWPRVMVASILVMGCMVSIGVLCMSDTAKSTSQRGERAALLGRTR